MMWCCTYLAALLPAVGEPKRAIEQGRRALTILEDSRQGSQGEAVHCAELSRACLAGGDVEGACQAAERGADVGRKIGARFYESRAQLALAAALLARDGFDAVQAARTALDRCGKLLLETGATSWQPFLHEGRAELARVEGDEASRERELREAHRRYTEMGATENAQRLARELGL